MGSLRIIGGKWRSRKIFFPDAVGLRPTPNMVKETLFNWLGHAIIDATCLDLFAGSGALSFEALSRGAKLVIATEYNKILIKNLKETATLLEATNFIPLQAQIPQQLDKIPPLYKFDIVFLDPPFRQNLIPITIQKLEEKNLLAKDVFLYMETEKNLDIKSTLNESWQILRNKTQGQVQYSLVQHLTQ